MRVLAGTVLLVGCCCRCSTAFTLRSGPSRPHRQRPVASSDGGAAERKPSIRQASAFLAIELQKRLVAKAMEELGLTAEEAVSGTGGTKNEHHDDDDLLSSVMDETTNADSSVDGASTRGPEEAATEDAESRGSTTEDPSTVTASTRDETRRVEAEQLHAGAEQSGGKSVVSKAEAGIDGKDRANEDKKQSADGTVDAESKSAVESDDSPAIGDGLTQAETPSSSDGTQSATATVATAESPELLSDDSVAPVDTTSSASSQNIDAQGIPVSTADSARDEGAGETDTPKVIQEKGSNSQSTAFATEHTTTVSNTRPDREELQEPTVGQADNDSTAETESTTTATKIENRASQSTDNETISVVPIVKIPDVISMEFGKPLEVVRSNVPPMQNPPSIDKQNA